MRRARTIAEALDHAAAVIAESGVGALSISEVARRMGVRGPSLYKYFTSLNAMYDGLFARAAAAHRQAIHDAMVPLPAGVPRLRALAGASVRWSVGNPALAQLLFWRPVPGFEPSASSYAISVSSVERLRAELAEAARSGQLSSDADSNDAVRLLTVVISGIFTRQVANQPGAAYDAGLFSRLTDEAVEMFLAHYRAR